MALLILGLLFLSLTVVSILLQIGGIIESFKKKWYIGAVAIFLPGFALVIGVAKYVLKKDLLQ